MPRHEKVDREVVLAVLRGTGSKARTAERLGLHPNTVRNVERIAEGLCYRCAQPRGDSDNATTCRKCLDAAAIYVRAAARRHQADGRCIACTNLIEPPSTTFCAIHTKLRSGDASRQRARDRARLGDEAFKQLQRDRARTQLYGPNANKVLHKAGHTCTMCGATYQKRRLHVHHVDRDHSNRSEENLAPLCAHCHHFVHAVLACTDLKASVAWMREHYPHINFS